MCNYNYCAVQCVMPKSPANPDLRLVHNVLVLILGHLGSKRSDFPCNNNLFTLYFLLKLTFLGGPPAATRPGKWHQPTPGSQPSTTASMGPLVSVKREGGSQNTKVYWL